MKNSVFWDVTPCGSCKNRSFGELSAPIIRVMEALSPSETEPHFVTSQKTPFFFN
jgi:hypothetical protein